MFCSHGGDGQGQSLSVRVQDQVSYIVSVGVVDKLSSYFHGVQDPIDASPEVGDFLLSGLEFISALTACAESISPNQDDPTHLLSTLQMTDLAGTVSMLYGILLHQVRHVWPTSRLIECFILKFFAYKN